jgi:hypothetical protein
MLFVLLPLAVFFKKIADRQHGHAACLTTLPTPSLMSKGRSQNVFVFRWKRSLILMWNGSSKLSSFVHFKKVV